MEYEWVEKPLVAQESRKARTRKWVLRKLVCCDGKLSAAVQTLLSLYRVRKSCETWRWRRSSSSLRLGKAPCSKRLHYSRALVEVRYVLSAGPSIHGRVCRVFVEE